MVADDAGVREAGAAIKSALRPIADRQADADQENPGAVHGAPAIELVAVEGDALERRVHLVFDTAASSVRAFERAPIVQTPTLTSASKEPGVRERFVRAHDGVQIEAGAPRQLTARPAVRTLQPPWIMSMSRHAFSGVTALAILSLLAGTAAAKPYQVKNIGPGAIAGFVTEGSATTSTAMNLDGTLLFTANDSTRGLELWKTDGTAAGTTFVKDIFAGPLSSNVLAGHVIGGVAYFNADDGVNGRELWASNATENGTKLVKDIRPGPEGSSPFALTGIGNTLLFTAWDGVTGFDIWKSDGATAGTSLVRDIAPGMSLLKGPEAALVPVGKQILFWADDGVVGSELWTSDGTLPGTKLVKDINLGAAGSRSGGLSKAGVIGNTFFFPADDGGGEALWKSDGTAAGTVKLKLGNAASISALNGVVLFSTSDSANGEELWKTDGTVLGTVLVKDIRPGAIGSAVKEMIALGPYVYFTADDGVVGRELWRTDGTAAGTVLVKDITPGTSGYGPLTLTAVGPFLFFSDDDGTHAKREPFRSDGTAAGTVMLDIAPAGSAPGRFWSVGARVVFDADDGLTGRELWADDLPIPAVDGGVTGDGGPGSSGGTSGGPGSSGGTSGGADAPTEDQDSSGCGCHTASARSSLSLAGLLLLVGAVVRRRRAKM